MAYNARNLTPIANNGKAGVVPAVWAYWNEAGDTVTTAGLIKNVAMNLKDQVLVIAATGASNKWYYVSAKAANGAITLTASE